MTSQRSSYYDISLDALSSLSITGASVKMGEFWNFGPINVTRNFVEGYVVTEFYLFEGAGLPYEPAL